MKATKAVATIEPGADDAESPNGTFHVVLSTPSKDRDGEEVKADEWEQPLPDHITFDMDHGMSVASTVGSGVPSLEQDGTLHVRGSYSSRSLAQEVRGLVNEGHIRTTSVAFLRKSQKDEKDGTARTKRELLNGAFVAIPANKEAVVLASKSASVELDDDDLAPIDVKAGRRNSMSDLDLIQQIHDNALALGAEPVGKSVADAETKAKYSADDLRRMLAAGQAYRNDNGDPSYPIADREDLQRAVSAVGRGGADHDAIRAYIIRRARALNATDVIPDSWNSDGSMKALTESTESEDAGESAAADSSAAEKAADESAAADKSESASENQIQTTRARALVALTSL